MSFDTLLLMSPSDCSALLSRILREQPGCKPIRTIATLEDLQAIPIKDLARARLISFANPVIVPAVVLAKLGYGAYNFHPGPPHYPGLAPAQMAIYEDATIFGITVHHMIEKVDAGPIVHADLCLVPPQATPMILEMRAFALLAKAFNSLAPHLTRDPRPLPVLPYTWRQEKSSRAQIRALCAMTRDLPQDEIDRRIRAFAGNGLGIDLTMEFSGHHFCLSGAAPQRPISATAPEIAGAA